MSLYSIYNTGEFKQLAHGYRSVIAIEGRKHVTVLDWTTLEHAKVDLKTWSRLKPMPQDYKPTRIKAAMKRRLAYATKTKLIAQAMASL